MADYNVDELSELVKADILAESQGVGEVPVVTSLSGINSLPALRGNEVVEAPLSLLSKPAEDAAKDAYAAIGNVQTATDNAMKAATSANQAAERVEDSILDLQEEKQIIAGVDAAEKVRVASENERIANENARKEAENARSSAETARENRETARQTAETARASAENDRAAAEKSRDNSEKGRATAESSRVSAENVRRSNEVARENTHAEMKALNKELKENPPRINADGNWELWDAAEKTYHDTKQTALGKSPIIVDGIWWIWNDDKDDFESTGWAVNSDFVLTGEKVEGVLGGAPMMYVEEWKHTHVPFKGGSMVKFNQEFFVSLKETSLPPVDLIYMADGIIAKVDEHTYATIGSYDAVGNKDDWRKMPMDQLRLISREGTLDGAPVDVRTLSGDDVYRFEPNLYIDLLRGVLKGKKVDLTLPKKNVTDALGYMPVTPSEKQELSNRIGVLEVEMNEAFSIIDSLWYGVEFDTTISSPDCTRIGNMELHKVLPIHHKMRGCLLDDNGNVVKYLNPADWTIETRDGSLGQVMVEIPAHFRKFETDGNKRRVRISELPLAGYHAVPRCYVSAYEATVQRSTSKLASVKNTSVDYRGGGNKSEWDGTYRSMLGMPATNISRTNFRKYARNRKTTSTEWNCMTYDVQKTLYWLFVTEYATLNTQAAYNPVLTSEGLRQGGLGSGVTNLNGTLWGTFNGYNPVIPCGTTDSLGNNTGEVIYTMPSEYDSSNTIEVQVPRYRGVENPFGHIWQWTDGINVRISPTSANGGDDLSKVFVCSDPAKFNDSNYNGYSHVGNEARTGGYVKSVIFGEYGEIMPDAVGGGSTTYLCDYHYTNIPTSETLRGVLFGGCADSGANAGFACANSNNVPSNTNASIGSRLCFIPQN